MLLFCKSFIFSKLDEIFDVFVLIKPELSEMLDVFVFIFSKLDEIFDVFVLIKPELSEISRCICIYFF